MTDSPTDRSNLPQKISSTELQEIIRRATELSFADASDDRELTEEDVLEIGEELGLSRTIIQRAISESAFAPPEESGFFLRRFGPKQVRASRFLTRPAERVQAELEHYLEESEYLSPRRHLGSRILYAPDRGWQTGLRSVIWPPKGEVPLGKADTIEISIRPIGDGVVVGLIADLGPQRKEAWGWTLGAGATIGGVIGGGVAMAAVLSGVAAGGAIIAAPVGIPVALIVGGAIRASYRKTVRNMQTKLEWILDQLERGASLAPPSGPVRRLFSGGKSGGRE